MLTLSKYVWPSTFKSCDMVVKPAILRLSRLVWPSTSKSPFASILPVNVETPVTANCPVVVVPTTLIPEEAVLNFFTPLKNKSTSAASLEIIWL